MTCRIFVGVLAAILVAAGIIWLIYQGHEAEKADANLQRHLERSRRMVEILEAQKR